MTFAKLSKRRSSRTDLPPPSGPVGLLVDYVRRRHIRVEVEVEVERSGTEAPVANGRYSVIESFNGSLRDELLNEELFDSLADARRKLAIWRYDYNPVS